MGTACIGVFHHDAIQTLPNGYTAALIDVERIFPAGTQGDSSGLPVDIAGDAIVVLDQNWNAVWYWDAFDPLNGGNGYPQMPVSRVAVLGEGCGVDCLAVFLRGPGISPTVQDWLHCNSLYYWPHDGATAPSTTPGDLIISSRHQLDEGNLRVAPVLSADLGAYSDAMGSAQLRATAIIFFGRPL